MESVENPRTVSHSFHRPWKSRPSGGIPTFPQLRRRSLFLREGKAKALPNLQRPKVGQIKPPKWAKRSCQTQRGEPRKRKRAAFRDRRGERLIRLRGAGRMLRAPFEFFRVPRRAVSLPARPTGMHLQALYCAGSRERNARPLHLLWRRELSPTGGFSPGCVQCSRAKLRYRFI